MRLAVTLTAIAAQAQDYSTLKVLQVGSGSATLTSAGTAEFIDSFTTSGTNLNTTNPTQYPVISLPTADNGSTHSIVESGTATSDGALTLSANGQYLTTQGYDATTGTASVANSSSIGQTIARIDASGNVNTTTTTSANSGGNIRGSVSSNGSSFYTTGSVAGAQYSTLGSNTSTQVTDNGTTVSNNLRDINIFSGNLYASTGSGTPGIYEIGTGLPTNSSAATLVLATTGTSPYDFAFANGGLTLYVADSGLGLQKYTTTAVGGTFALQYTSTVSGLTGLTFNPNNNTLYGVTPSSLISFVDNTATSSFTQTTLATAAAKTAFRGVDFAPVPAPAGIVSMGIGLGMAGLGALVRRRRVARAA